MTHYCPGIPDDQFIRGNIPMTKQEIRILALAKARISSNNIVIDIGAGTGSLSVEAAYQASGGQVYAIEREEEGIRLINANILKFGLTNITAIMGAAPDAMRTLPQADVILIGGSGGQLAGILNEAHRLLRPGGRLVVTSITVETLYLTLEFLKSQQYQTEACSLQVNRIKPIGAVHMFQALNPIFIVSATKEEVHER